MLRDDQWCPVVEHLVDAGAVAGERARLRTGCTAAAGLPRRLSRHCQLLRVPPNRRSLADPEGVLDDIATLYPHMDSTALQERLGRIMFVADLWGAEQN